MRRSTEGGVALYNKLFTKILDSTIWLESDATRLVWITFIAAMDEDGFVALASVGNVAARARVTVKAAEAAVRALEGPDGVDPNQEHEGRRIERVPSGWMVLNATKYRDIIRRATAREKTRERVAKHRASNAAVTPRNGEKQKVTTSYTEAVAVSKAEKPKVAPLALPGWLDAEKWNAYVKTRKAKTREPAALKAALEKLEGFRAAGHDPNAIVAESLSNGWQGLFAPKEGVNGHHSGPAWWSSDALILAKAEELGITPRGGESYQQLKGRIEIALQQ